MLLSKELLNNQERKDISKFMQEASKIISNMIKIANNSQITENRQKAKELLKQLSNRIDIMYDRKLISKEEVNNLVNQMEGYI